MAVKTGRRTIYVPQFPDSALYRLLSMWGDDKISHTLETAVDRYLTVIEHSLPEFSVAEWCVIFDALNSVWLSDELSILCVCDEVVEAIGFDALDVKWKVDGDGLKKKLAGFGVAEKHAVVEVTQLFYHDHSDGDYSAVVSRILGLFRSELPAAAGPRSRRLDPDRLGE